MNDTPTLPKRPMADPCGEPRPGHVVAGYRLGAASDRAGPIAVFAARPLDDTTTDLVLHVSGGSLPASIRRELRRAAVRQRALCVHAWSAFHDAGCTVDGRAWFAELRFDGGGLDELVADADAETVRRVVLEATAALAQAHDGGVFHGALDATAIRIRRDGEPGRRGGTRIVGLGLEQFRAIVHGAAPSAADLALADVRALRAAVLDVLAESQRHWPDAGCLGPLLRAYQRVDGARHAAALWREVCVELGVRAVRRVPTPSGIHRREPRGVAGNGRMRAPCCRRLRGLVRMLFGV